MPNKADKSTETDRQARGTGDPNRWSRAVDPHETTLVSAMDAMEDVALFGSPDSTRVSGAKGLIDAAPLAREAWLVASLCPPGLRDLGLPSMDP